MSKGQGIAQGVVLSMGLDVDAKTSFVSVVDVATGELVYEGRVNHTEVAWDRFLTRFSSCRIWACYEAGLTGFSLCRRLRARGIDCKSVATGTNNSRAPFATAMRANSGNSTS